MKDWNDLGADQQNDVIMFAPSAYQWLTSEPVPYETFAAKYGAELALRIVVRLAARHGLRAVRYPDGLHFSVPELFQGDVVGAEVNGEAVDKADQATAQDVAGSTIEGFSTGWPVLPFEVPSPFSAK